MSVFICPEIGEENILAFVCLVRFQLFSGRNLSLLNLGIRAGLYDAQAVSIAKYCTYFPKLSSLIGSNSLFL